MIEPRLYRAAFLPALLAVVVAAFSLENRPRPVPQGLAADVLFDGTLATSSARTIVADARDRRVGTPGDLKTARSVAAAFHRAGFVTTTDSFDDDGTRLVNVIGRRPGLSRRAVVVVAARDALSVPDATGSAADTAALMEIGRTLAGRAQRKTIVLASVDGGTRGDVGARRLVGQLGGASAVSGILVLSNTGAARSHGPLLIDWSNDDTRGSLGLRRTAADSLRNELGVDGGPEATAPAQVSRLAFPVGDGAQGTLLAHGLPAVRLSGSGELAPPREHRGTRDLDPERYGPIGRAALRVVSALDASPGPPAHGPTSYVTLAGSVMPGWAVALVAASLILPALIASVDGLARARRRRSPVEPWLSWTALGVVPAAAGLALAELLVLTGAARDAPLGPLDPSAAPVDSSAAANMGGVALAVLVAWVLVRTRLLRRGRPLPDATAPGAGCAVSLALCLVAIAAWVVNPFAGLALALTLNCWMLATMGDGRPATRGWLLALGLVPALVVAATYMHELSLGPLAFAWYVFLLVTGGQVGVAMTVIWTAALGVLFSVVAIVFAHARAGAREGATDTRPRNAAFAGPRAGSGRSRPRGRWGAGATSGRR